MPAWAIDGQAAIGSRALRAEKRFYYNVATTHATPQPDELRDERNRAAARQSELFGDDASPAFSLPGLRGLIGRDVAGFGEIARTDIRLTIENREAFENVDPGALEVPVQLIGRIRGGLSQQAAAARIAVALNGRIVATTRTWPDVVQWMAMLPPAALRPGANEIELFVVDPANDDRILNNP